MRHIMAMLLLAWPVTRRGKGTFLNESFDMKIAKCYPRDIDFNILWSMSFIQR